MSRLFAAILPDEPFRKMLLKQSAAAVQIYGGGVPTPPENFHMTLAFLGETSLLSQAKEALSAITASPFSLFGGDGGAFPGRGGFTLWQGTADCKPLSRLQQQLVVEFRRRGFVLEERPFIPHFTLVRRAPQTAFIPLPHPEPCVLQVSDICLMESVFLPGGVTYRILARQSLKLSSSCGPK